MSGASRDNTRYRRKGVWGCAPVVRVSSLATLMEEDVLRQEMARTLGASWRFAEKYVFGAVFDDAPVPVKTSDQPPAARNLFRVRRLSSSC